MADGRQLAGEAERMRAGALGILEVRVGVLEHGGGSFEGLLLCSVEMEFNYGLDSAAAYDAGSAEGDVAEAVLACHER